MIKYIALFFVILLFRATIDLITWEPFGMKLNYLCAFWIAFYFGQWYINQNETKEEQEYF